MGNDVGLRDREERNRPLIKQKKDLAMDLFPIDYRRLQIDEKNNSRRLDEL